MNPRIASHRDAVQTIARCIARCAEPARDGRWRRWRVAECERELRPTSTPTIARMCAEAAARVGETIRARAG